jgi:hypothetical protein
VLSSAIALRADVLSVTDARWPIPVYSGRSSWADVKASGGGRLVIVTKGGKRQEWDDAAISDDSISLKGKMLAKADVATISYLRFRPLTDSEEYVHHENVDFLAPRLWFRGLMLGKISVKLYDASMVEDNSDVGCVAPLPVVTAR